MIRALVVDDSRSMRTILSGMLRGLGALVDEAGDAAAALEFLEAGTVPDVMLVDWNMPGMSGLDLVDALRRRAEWRQIAVVMVTTETAPAQVVRALLAGANEYIVKPFSADAVASKLTLLGLPVARRPATSGAPH